MTALVPALRDAGLVPRALIPPTRARDWGRRWAEVIALLTAVFWLIWLFPGTGLSWVVTFGYLGLQWARRRRWAKLGRRFRDAVAMHAAGDLEQARDEFDALCRAPAMGADRAVFLLFRGITELEIGEARPALAMLEAARDSGWITRDGALSAYHEPLRARLATAYARLGHQDAALAELEQVRRDTPPARRGVLLPAEVEVLARLGRHREALDRIEADADRAEHLLTVRRMRAVRALEAFCVHSLGGDYRTGGLARAAQQALHDPVTVRSLGGLARDWPELQAFLDAHSPRA